MADKKKQPGPGDIVDVAYPVSNLHGLFVVKDVSPEDDLVLTRVGDPEHHTARVPRRYVVQWFKAQATTK